MRPVAILVIGMAFAACRADDASPRRVPDGDREGVCVAYHDDDEPPDDPVPEDGDTGGSSGGESSEGGSSTGDGPDDGFVEPEDAYLVGDWNSDGVDDLAVRRDHCLHEQVPSGEKIQCFGNGDVEDEYLVGDWNGDGIDDVAVRRDHCIHEDVDSDGSTDTIQCWGNGNAEDEYLVGDWNGDGVDDVAVRRAHCVHKHVGGEELVQCYGNGGTEDQYLIGDWDGNGVDDLAVRRAACVHEDFNGDGVEERVQCLGLGAGEDEYVVGDWDGNGVDDLGVRRDHCVLQDIDGDGTHDATQCWGNGTAIEAALGLAGATEPLAAGHVLRFDTGGLHCDLETETCSDPKSCLCPSLRDVLFEGPPHYIVVGNGPSMDEARAAGHNVAFYIDRLNDNWQTTSPEKRAQEIFDAMLDECECDERPVPRWVVLNEVWRSTWLTDNDYREWVVGVVRHLSQTHERKVLLAVPFKFPDKQTINPWWWQKLQQYAYLGIEGYISGERALAMGNTIAALRAEYKEMKDSYAKVGVRPERMILLEHFGQTTKGTDYGRAGIPAWKWEETIRYRARAARGMFHGAMSYGWKGNAMLETDANRRSFMKAWIEETVP